MLKKHIYKDLTWIDLKQPTQEEVRGLLDKYNFHPNIAEDLLTPSFKSSATQYESVIHLILHFPALKHTHSNSFNQEIDFVVGKDFMITARNDTIDAMHKFTKEFETKSILDRKDIGKKPEDVFFLLLNKLYNSITHELEHAQSSLRTAQEMIFRGEEKKMVRELSDIGRDLLNAKQSISPHKETLLELQVVGNDFFGDEFDRKIKKIMEKYNKIRNNIKNHREYLKELKNTNDSLLSTKQNETMTVLTIMAFVTFPLSLIASIFGMNTVNMPIIGGSYDFWMVLGIMFVLTTFMFLFFKSKKWL